MTDALVIDVAEPTVEVSLADPTVELTITGDTVEVEVFLADPVTVEVGGDVQVNMADPTVEVEVGSRTPVVVEVGGAVGPPGPPGPAGGTYRHVQSVPASTWTINHNLGFRPGGVYVQDSGGDQQVGRVTHLSADTLQIEFFGAGVPASFSGEAFLS